jgi:DNA (cytosine-5)-methyltransferase 1
MPITYGSVCSGIEAATVAWHPLGWRAEWYAEIEQFPCAVLAHHYPATPNYGDMTRLAAMTLSGKIPAPEVLVGGTPCQAFSVAGMREGLADPRGALTIKYVELLDAIDHVRIKRGEPEATCLWENVPGVLSDKGNAFGCFLGALVGESEELQPPGGKWKDAGCVYGPTRTVAWRVLDAQYFGLAQRRRRVFVVASARAGFDPLEVLFEREGVRRDTPPRRGEGQDVACTLDARTEGGGFPGTDGATGGHVVSPPDWPRVFGGNNTSGPIDVAPARNACSSASGRMDFESEAFVVSGTLQANGKAAGSATQQDAKAACWWSTAHKIPMSDTSRLTRSGGTTAWKTPCSPSPRTAGPRCGWKGGDGQVVGTLSAGGGKPGQGQPCIAFSCKDHGADAGELAPTLRAMGHSGSHPNSGGQVAVQGPSGVRRLTPRECERLQGFPDDYTLTPYRGRVPGLCPDGPRYKAIGNSKAVFVVRWIGQRIQQQLERLA